MSQSPARLLGVLTLSLILASCGTSTPTPAATAGGPSAQTPVSQGPDAPDTVNLDVGHGHGERSLPGMEIDPSTFPTNARLGTPVIRPSTRLGAQALPANIQPSMTALKVLVLSSGPTDFGLATAKAMLQESGVPFDVLDATVDTLDMNRLIDSAGVGRYQGVILTSSALIYADGTGLYPSALDAGEWATLFEYERTFGARQLALYGSPGTTPEDYGLRAAGGETSTTSMTLSTAGRAVFGDLTATAVPVNYAYTYPATVTPVDGVTTQVLATDPAGRVLAATSTSADGRERLILTSAQNPYLLHSQLLSYGLTQWLTRGVHLGEHRRFLQVDVDDLFLSGDRIDPNTLALRAQPYRLSGNDLLNIYSQMKNVQAAYPVAKSFRYAMMFNGGGANTSVLPLCVNWTFLTSDMLSSAAKCLAGQFDWVNHTRDHLRMDVMDLPTATTQIADNFTIGARMGLSMSRNAMVTGEHSGLGNMDPKDDGTYNDSDVNLPKQDLGLGRSNPNMLSAAVSAGVRYIASDHSVASHWDASCITCGVPHPLNSGVFLVPRYPNAMAYYVTDPTEETAYYNSMYAPGGKFPYYDHRLTYAEILDKDSDFTLNHILDGGAFPHYMHQTNLRQYAAGKSLATDWVRASLDKYGRYSTLPLTTLAWSNLGPYLERHTREEKAKAAGTLSGVWNRATNQVTVTSTAGSVPVTVTGDTAGALYGTYRSRSIDVNGSVTVTVAPR
ncbi:hypothetical protein HNQ07_001065 [Deinococcus metalli]|uniref:Agd3 CBM87 domain-containing protein n=1 Tax=Deinococcus metalli TaxID=1141878 RepID=A0A7W8KEG4_9DEIO|nr:hypothetical protein [Deinococcus metalli]MBB5375608.1 hypothetical protein [Deinococcus metalli]GHF38416.1 hypothetical protein GCM10017781_13930 [Deinococcus metalli]